MGDTPYGEGGSGGTGWGVTTGPGVTALGLAAARAVETSRRDRLIDDPFARRLFEAAGARLPMLAAWPAEGVAVSDAEALHLHGSRYIGLRTRFYDDVVQAAVRDGVPQVVLLGAGLDTRAWRLDLPAETVVLEVDQAGVLAYKETVLASSGAEPRCRRVAVAVDLRDDWTPELRARGFDRERRTVWVAEGLLPYLPAARAQLLKHVGEHSAPGSVLAFDRIAGDATQGDRLESLSRRSGVDMTSLLARAEGDDLRRVLEQRGWEVHEEATDALADRYGRTLEDPFPNEGRGAPAVEPPWLETIFLSARLPL